MYSEKIFLYVSANISLLIAKVPGKDTTSNQYLTLKKLLPKPSTVLFSEPCEKTWFPCLSWRVAWYPPPGCYRDNRVFRKLTTLTIMAILASVALLREKNPATKCYPQWD